MKIQIKKMNYKPIRLDPEKPKEGKQDYFAPINRPSGLPKNWRDIIIK